MYATAAVGWLASVKMLADSSGGASAMADGADNPRLDTEQLEPDVMAGSGATRGPHALGRAAPAPYEAVLGMAAAYELAAPLTCSPYEYSHVILPDASTAPGGSSVYEVPTAEVDGTFRLPSSQNGSAREACAPLANAISRPAQLDKTMAEDVDYQA